MDQIDTEINGMLKKIKEERQYIEIGYEDIEAWKCDYCKQHIDIGKGGYMNVYDAAWKMTSYHVECYRNLLRITLREEILKELEV